MQANGNELGKKKKRITKTSTATLDSGVLKGS